MEDIQLHAKSMRTLVVHYASRISWKAQILKHFRTTDTGQMMSMTETKEHLETKDQKYI